MKKNVITWAQYRAQSPFKCGQLLTQLEKCRVKPKNTKKKNFKLDFTKDSLERYIALSILKN